MGLTCDPSKGSVHVRRSHPRPSLPRPTSVWPPASHVSARTVKGLLTGSYQRPAGAASVTTHLVEPAERFTAERLDTLAYVQGVPGAVLQRVPAAFRSESSVSPGRHRHRPRITDSIASLPST
ncbi:MULTISPECIES: hypothetical protein [unclassified Streptomyces]|uniref:hypothetical protein n=1 Tax=unclassified Streptomyces TaxID=2593676 RepID=UPI000AB02D09